MIFFFRTRAITRNLFLSFLFLGQVACSEKSIEKANLPQVDPKPGATVAVREEVDFELVQSVPMDTELEEPSIRLARDVWLDLIYGAKKTIDIEQMYVANDPKKTEALEPVLVALKTAADRGVKIRIVISNSAASDAPSIARLKALPNVQFATINLSPLTNGIQHAKFWIIDGEKSFVGSQNLDWRALTEIHELGILVKSKNTAERLTAIFETDLEIATTGKLPDMKARKVAPKSTTDGIELVASPAVINPDGIRPALDALLEMINGASKKIQIQVMDYSTYGYKEPGQWLVIDDALRAAAARGVTVDLLVSHWNQEDPEIDSIKSLSTVPNVRVKICEVPKNTVKGFIPFARVTHSKYMVVDSSRVWISTSNWQKNYFTASRDVEFILKKERIVQESERIFERVWNAPYSNFIDTTKKYPKPSKGTENP